MPRGLYIHIPFCKSKCIYCDFASCAGRASLIDSYLKALAREAAQYKNKFKPQTLYIGGGTPSLLNARQINILLGIIEKNFGSIKNFKEATFECNPESITAAKLKLLKSRGINRLSIGAQVLEDKGLKALGRAHNKAQILKSFKLAKKYFTNISLDLIAGLPGQSLAAFKKSLNEAVALNPAHISVYGLQVEENTPLHKTGFTGDDGLTRAMLEYTAKYLAANGLAQYEISNFARKGCESLHNINYWQNGQYLGLGAAAASYINGTRRVNTTDLDKYISGKKTEESRERLKGKAKAGEAVLLALRMSAGLKITPQIKKYFTLDFKRLCKRGLLIKEKNNIRLSEEGKYFANEVSRCFVEPF